MKLFDFNKYFPDETACRKAFKEMRDREGVVCQHCGSHDVVWLESKQQYQCKHCRHRTTLRSGTVMHGSKLPFMYWFIAMHLLTATKKSISAAELQRQLGHKRYQPIWEMMHKLRSVMGKRDDKYTLKGSIELDEGFFSTETPDAQKQEKLKAGAGSQKKGKVLVMSPDTLQEEFWTPENQLWLATGGFGCNPKASGRAIYAACLGDGEESRWNREDFVGVLDEQYLPAWAQEKLESLRASKQDHHTAPAMGGMEMG